VARLAESMGQGASGLSGICSERVERAVESLDVLVWDELRVINGNTVGECFERHGVDNTFDMQDVEQHMKRKHVAQREKHDFFAMKDTCDNAGLNSLRNFHFRMLLRYDLALTYIHQQIQLKI
jgi:hypothetical protein